jgi:hypothetical protein
MLKLAALFSCAALCLTLMTAVTFDDIARISAAPQASGIDHSVRLAQFNACPNGKCRK